MLDQFKNMMIGIFVMVAIAIIVFMMLFLHPNIGDEGKAIRVRFADIDKITQGTRVTFAGKPIGEVVKINEIHGGERIERNGAIYVYELKLAIDSNVQVYITDEITARTSGLLGEKSVAIMPVFPKHGEERILVTDQILYADDVGSVEGVFKDFRELSGKIEKTLDGFIEAFDQLHKDNVWEHIGEISENVRNTTDVINKHISRIIENADQLIATLNQPEKISQIISNVASSSNNLNRVIADVQEGKGSVGRILMKDDFYLSLSSLMSKAEVVLNDINHYGILFHLDKSWQRLRARRLNLLASLQTPQEFRNYFNDEIDSISTSLERVAMVIEEVEALPCHTLWNDPNYIKVYAELLRRVATLEEYLQMYNQEVVDTQVRETEFIPIEYCLQ